MRFAYIDSHGNEVPIPSVDALALRIELGAIGPETQLYDAQADHWGPANTHEIFHTLSREGQSDGFVAPPPVAPPPVAAPTAKPAKPKPEPRSEAKAEKRSEAKPAAKPKSEPAKANAADLGLTLADPAPPPPPKPSAPEPEPAGGGLDLSLDLAPRADPPKKRPEPPPSEAGTFDYGDLGAGLQLEDSPIDVAGPLSGLGGGVPSEVPPMQFGGGGGNDLQLEQPMSAFTPDSPPGWMESGPNEGAPLDFSPAAASAPVSDATPVRSVTEAPARQRREPKDKPPPPKFKRQSSISATPIILTVLVLALGVGGYVAWPNIQARLFPPPPPPPPAMVMPALSPELMPRMRELAEGAIADVVAQVDASTGSGVPTEPDQQWLSGRYLADASQFATIEAFWTGMATFLAGVQDADWQGYHERLIARADAAGLGADAAAVVERADSGFVAATEARAAAYATLDGVIQAALDLHDFLVQNEANIEYRPASTSTADPILEAVPNSAAIGDQMLEMVDRITEGLTDHLGTLDRATRARLTSALTARLQEVGIE